MRHTREQEAYVEASFVVSNIIAKSSKPFSDGEYIKNCMTEVSAIICPDIKHKFENLSLTVVRRIECIATNLKEQLLSVSKSFNWYSIAIDKSNDQKDTAQLLIFIRGCTSEFEIIEELLSMESLKDQTTGDDIFKKIEDCIAAYNLQWKKLVSVTTNGARNLTGKNVGTVKKIQDRIREIDPDYNLIALHCIIHQEVLCKNVLKVDHVTSRVIKLVNLIRSSGLKHRQFIIFLEDLDAEYTDIPFHSHIRWLKMKHITDFPEFTNNDWLCDFAFTLDIITHLNTFNCILQGKNVYAHDSIKSLNAFNLKLQLFQRQILIKKLYHFPTLKSLNIDESKIKKYGDTIKALSDDFSSRFSDFRVIENSLAIIRDPFLANVDNIPSELQLEILDLQCDTDLKDFYPREEICKFYNSLNSERFGKIKDFARKITKTQHLSRYACQIAVFKVIKSAYIHSECKQHVVWRTFRGYSILLSHITASDCSKYPNEQAAITTQCSPRTTS
ncbi:general transcription factor II-I repeat domain-containing protein 2-like [Arctopsyche grandis]|uniref:general transcription factor II-I repeat domain-containing protein 2-like n=1 Tax=Arctopsyche grandis TaxID=121162 RepID=UPI00406D656D